MASESRSDRTKRAAAAQRALILCWSCSCSAWWSQHSAFEQRRVKGTGSADGLLPGEGSSELGALVDQDRHLNYPARPSATLKRKLLADEGGQLLRSPETSLSMCITSGKVFAASRSVPFVNLMRVIASPDVTVLKARTYRKYFYKSLNSSGGGTRSAGAGTAGARTAGSVIIGRCIATRCMPKPPIACRPSPLGRRAGSVNAFARRRRFRGPFDTTVIGEGSGRGTAQA